MKQRDKALLILSDGSVFRGRAYGAHGTVRGPLGRHFSATGYEDALTAPEHADTLLALAFPHVGNTGILTEKPTFTVGGVILREPAIAASSHLSAGELEPALEAAGIVGICDVDTRAVLRREDVTAMIISGPELPSGAWEGIDDARTPLISLLTEGTAAHATQN